MAPTKPSNAIDVNKLIEKLDAARGTTAYISDMDRYDRHHPERDGLDNVFDDLIDWVRSHQTQAELTELAMDASDPDLQPGALILIDGKPATVREIRFHAPRTHADSGLPQHQAAMEIVTGLGAQWLSLTPRA